MPFFSLFFMMSASGSTLSFACHLGPVCVIVEILHPPHRCAYQDADQTAWNIAQVCLRLLTIKGHLWERFLHNLSETIPQRLVWMLVDLIRVVTNLSGHDSVVWWAVCWCQHCGSSGEWSWWDYGMGSRMLLTNRCILLMAFGMHIDVGYKKEICCTACGKWWWHPPGHPPI